MNHDLRISLNMDDGSYSVEYIEQNKLYTIAEAGREAEAIREAKDYLKGEEEKGDRIMTVYGDIYTWTGKSWSLTKPSNR